MTRNQVEIKYDEFFGTGLWERDYKGHIVIFTEQCLMHQEKQTNCSLPSLKDFKNRRKNLNMSMQNVTDKTTVSKATISRIERGHDADYSTVKKLHEFYLANGV